MTPAQYRAAKQEDEMTKTSRQKVELDGKAFEVSWSEDGERALVYQVTKRGPRTLQGYGRQWRPELANRVTAQAKKERK